MGCRANLFSLLGAFVLLYICGGLMLAANAYTNVTSTKVAPVAGLSQSQAQEAYNGGAASASGGIALGVVCSGLPFLWAFASLANRNRSAMRTERRHQEILEATRDAAVIAAARPPVTVVVDRTPPPASTPPIPTPVLKPLSPEMRTKLQQAAQALKSKDAVTARQLISEVLKSYPDAPEALYMASFVIGDPAKQIQALERALRAKPDYQQAADRLAKLRPQDSLDELFS